MSKTISIIWDGFKTKNLPHAAEGSKLEFY